MSDTIESDNGADESSVEAVSAQAPRVACSNCGTPLNGQFCSACGQEDKAIRRPFFSLLRELLRVVLELDGRAYRSFALLLIRPGYLSREFVNGRRQHYTPPLRLFLIVSISFFVIMTAVNTVQGLQDSLRGGPAPADPQAQQLEEEMQQELADAGIATESVNDDDLNDLKALILRIDLPFLSAEANANLQAAMQAQAEANYAELVADPADFLSGYLEYITLFMLAMMPILALLLKLFFLGSGRYYIEHLVLTIHNHSFLILILLLQMGLGALADAGVPVLGGVFGALRSLSGLWIPVYLFLSLKFFVGWGWFLTTVIFLLTTVLYGIVLITSMVLLGLVVFLLF